MKNAVIFFFIALFIGGVFSACSKKKGCNSCPHWGKVTTEQPERV